MLKDNLFKIILFFLFFIFVAGYLKKHIVITHELDKAERRFYGTAEERSQNEKGL